MEPGAQEPAGKPASRFIYGEPVTVLIAAEVHAEYEVWRDRRQVPAVSLAFPDGPDAGLLDVPYEIEGVTLVRGDILPTLREALKDGVAMREPEPGECGECVNCAEDARLRREYGELLAALRGTSGTEGNEGDGLHLPWTGQAPADP